MPDEELEKRIKLELALIHQCKESMQDHYRCL
jgi:hypothetical protein|nr:MAG TPA: hypothetical protein [Caudoviricetes sp.]